MKKNSLKISVIISYLYLLVSIIGTFLVTPILLDYIGDEKYGLLSFCTAITTWLTVVTTALGSSYIYFAKKEDLNTSNSQVTNTLFFKLFSIFSIGIFLVAICLFPLLYGLGVSFGNYSWDDSKIIYVLLSISTFQVCFTILFSVFNNFLITDKRFIFVRAKHLITTILVFLFNLLFTFLTKSIISIAFVSLASCIANNLLSMFYALRMRKMRFANAKLFNHKAMVKNIFIYSSFVLANTLVSTMNNSMDKILLGFFSEPSNVTLYSLSFSFSLYLATMIGSISETFVPKIHELLEQKNHGEADKLFIKISKLQSLIIIVVVFGFVACGYDFVKIWVSEARISVYYYALVLNILTIVPLTSTTCIDFERACNKHKFRAIVYVVAALLNVVISTLLLFTLKSINPIWCCIIGTIFSKILSEWIILPIYDKLVLKISIKKYFLNLFIFAIYGILAIGATFLYRYFVVNYLNSPVLLVTEIVLFIIVFSAFMIIFNRNYLLELLGKRNENEK